MRTPSDERTGYRVAAWAGALLFLQLARFAGNIDALADSVEVISESVSADYQLADAAPTLLAVPLLMVVALGGLLQRWGAGWLERVLVAPVLLVVPYLLLAWYVAALWSTTDLGLTGAGAPPWPQLLARTSGHFLLLGIGALAVGFLAGRLGASPTALVLLVLLPAFALTVVPPWYGMFGPAEWESPVWFSLQVLVDEPDELTPYGACPVLGVGLCGRTVGPLGAGVHLLVLLALLAAVATAASRVLRPSRRRLAQ